MTDYVLSVSFPGGQAPANHSKHWKTKEQGGYLGGQLCQDRLSLRRKAPKITVRGQNFFLRKNVEAFFPRGPQQPKKKMQAPRGDTRDALSLAGLGRGASAPAAARPPGPPVPGRRGDRHDSAEWDSHLHSPRSSTAPRVFRSAEPEARARPRWCPHAAERFPGDTGGRSPAVAKAVARARAPPAPRQR